MGGGPRGAGGKGTGEGRGWEREPLQDKAWEREFRTPGSVPTAGDAVAESAAIARSKVHEAQKLAAEYDAYYDSYEVSSRTAVADRDARRASAGGGGNAGFAAALFRPLTEFLRKGFGLPEPWMRETVGPGVTIELNGRDADVVAVDGRTIRYKTVETLNGRRTRVEKTAELTDAVVAHNFLELSLAEIRPTENGLSALRLDAAADYLNEPVRVVPRTLLDGRVEYYAIDGHHRLLAAAQAGVETMRVQLIHGYGYDTVQGKFDHPHNPRFPVPKDVFGLEIDPLRVDDYRGGPLGEKIYGDNYYYGRAFYDLVPREGAVVGGTDFFPVQDLGGRTYPVAGGGEVSFTGRVFGQGSASTVYEAVVRDTEGVRTLVAVKIADHALDPIQGEVNLAREAGVVERAALQGLTTFHGLASVEGRLALIVDAAPGRSLETVDPTWITAETVRQVHEIFDVIEAQGWKPGDLQIHVDRLGNARVIDFEGLDVPGLIAPHATREGTIDFLRLRRSLAGLPPV